MRWGKVICISCLCTFMTLSAFAQNTVFKDETATRLPVETNFAVRAAAGDVDGDGDLDVIVASGLHTQRGRLSADQDFILQINNGLGIFTNEAASRLPASAFGTQVASAAILGDVDGDSDLDIFVTNGTSGGGFPSNFSGFQNRLWINNGTGFFTDETDTRLPAITDASFHAAFGDVDGDGDLDILIGNVGPIGTGQQNRLLINNGAGVFTDETTARLPALADITLAVVLEDLDGDSDLDIVVGNGSGLSRLLINNGSGVFADETATRLSPNPTASDVMVADVDGGGSLDILFAKFTGIRLFMNSGSGFFTEETGTRIPGAFFGSHGLALADVDNDSDVDVFVTVPGSQDRFLVNNGAGFFIDATLSFLPTFVGIVRYATFADVDNDGDADLYVPVWVDFLGTDQDRLLINLVSVNIDIKPGSDPNAINPANRGLIPVAILTTDGFDATTVSPVTVGFGPGGASIAHRSGHLEDVDEDGDLDLVLHFRTQGTGIQCGETEASLVGETFGGRPIHGSDSIVTVGCN